MTSYSAKTGDLHSMLLKSGVFNKADIILNDPRNALRLVLSMARKPALDLPDNATKEEVQNSILLANSAGYKDLVGKIRALLPIYYEGDELKGHLNQFDLEVERAEEAIATGSSKSRNSGGVVDDRGPNLYSPERMMLWFATLNYMELKKVPDGEERQSIAKIADELARSRGAALLLDKFSFNVTMILAALKIEKNDCEIRWGEPGSWFYHMRKDPAQGVNRNLINFDVLETLLIGDLVQHVMMHELGHYLYDTAYPERIADLIKQITDLQDKSARSGALTDDEQKSLIRTNYERMLLHRVWNSAADNAVDNASHLLSSGDQPIYSYQCH